MHVLHFICLCCIPVVSFRSIAATVAVSECRTRYKYVIFQPDPSYAFGGGGVGWGGGDIYVPYTVVPGIMVANWPHSCYHPQAHSHNVRMYSFPNIACWCETAVLKSCHENGPGGDDGMLRLVLSGELPWKWYIYLITKQVIHSLSVLKNSRCAKPLVYIMGCVLSKGWRLLKNSISYLKVTIVCSGALCSVLASCSICAFSRHRYTWLS